jgi:hypothetical protein
VVTGYILDASRRAYSSFAKGAELSGVVIKVGERSGREDTWACAMIPSSGPETSFDTNPSDELPRVYAKGCDDSRPAPLAAEDHLGMDQVMI